MWNNFDDAHSYVAEGDSITVGFLAPAGYPSILTSSFSETTVTNLAVNGSTIGIVAARSAGVMAVHGSRNIVSLLVGRNDLVAGGYDRTTFLNAVASYLDALRAAGRQVVLGTILPSNPVGFNAERNAVNTIFRTWVGVHCDAIADFAADPTIGPDGAEANATYYNSGDQTHPTASGQAIMATIMTTTLKSLTAH